MIDPFTLATGIVNILGLATQIAQVTTAYASSVSDAPIAIRALEDELGRLVLVLKDLEAFLKDQGSTSRTFEETSVICRTKDACEATLTQLGRKMKQLTDPKGLKKAFVHLRWPLSEESIKELTLDVQRYTATFQFSLTIQGCNVLSKTAADVDTILKSLVEVLQHTQTTAISIPSLAKEVEMSLSLSARMLDLLGSFNLAQSDQRLDNISEGVSSLILMAEAKQNSENLDVGSAKKDTIMRWLCQTDVFADYLDARRKCAPGTGTWLLSDERFKAWEQTPKSLLWVHGMAGCGKSMLSSTVMSRYFTEDDSARPGVAYYFFDSNDSRKKSPTNFLCSCIAQLCKGLPYNDLPHAVRSLHDSSSRYPASISYSTSIWKQLLLAFQETLRDLPEVFVIIDAVDEGSLGQGDLDSLILEEALGSLHSYPHVHVMITSMHKGRIVRHMETLATTKIALGGILHEADIEFYINERLKTGRLQGWSEIAKNDIRRTLKTSAGNLFGWVTLQLDLLEKCLTLPVLKRSLRNLPQDLFGTYDKIIQDMDDDYRDLALLALQWLIYADIPMTIEAVAEIMSIIKDDTGQGMEYSPDYRLRNTDDVLSVCAGLISIQHQGSGRIVRLAHSTVRAYFLKASIPGLPSADQRKEKAQELIAQCCLAQLRYLSGLKQPTNGSPQPFRLPQSLRWFLSDLRWTLGLRDGGDLFMVLSEALYPSEKQVIEPYVGLQRDVSRLLEHARSLPSSQVVLEATELLIQELDSGDTRRKVSSKKASGGHHHGGGDGKSSRSEVAHHRGRTTSGQTDETRSTGPYEYSSNGTHTIEFNGTTVNLAVCDRVMLGRNTETGRSRIIINDCRDREKICAGDGNARSSAQATSAHRRDRSDNGTTHATRNSIRPSPGRRISICLSSRRRNDHTIDDVLQSTL